MKKSKVRIKYIELRRGSGWEHILVLRRNFSARGSGRFGSGQLTRPSSRNVLDVLT